jgi:hypothetical protein
VPLETAEAAAIGKSARDAMLAERYADALLQFEILHESFMSDEAGHKIAPNRPGYRQDMACVHWLMGNRLTAIEMMRGLAEGILQKTIAYGDLAGGLKQGLLLYYMATTLKLTSEQNYAIAYLRNRLKRKTHPEVWPVPVARFYLDELSFDGMWTAALDHGSGQLAGSPDDIAHKRAYMERRKLCVALFADSVRKRSRGDEASCISRMRECCSPENHTIEPEWYLARLEVAQSQAAQ